MLDSGFRDGLTGLKGFSHVQMLWWTDGCDNEARSTLTEKGPYKFYFGGNDHEKQSGYNATSVKNKEDIVFCVGSPHAFYALLLF